MFPRLVLINGLPGTGKSTLARLYADGHSLTLALDIDSVRAMLGCWLDTPTEAGLAARELALAMARTHLSAGRDVIIPQFLGRLEFVVQLERLSVHAGARFIELALLVPPQEAAERFQRRSQDPQNATHRDASALLERLGGIDQLHVMNSRLEEVLGQRPRTQTVRPTEGQVDQTYQALCACIDFGETLRSAPVSKTT